ncbi:hypothetical protein [Kocuria rhizosphaericola]|uniref:hypothetical protein n=1 Tax=Kocuria rhizosphaericola TaxID=3376284 RepID=UPI0037B0E1A7
MRWSGEIEAGGWIRARLSAAWGTVGSAVPEGFAAYARILHPAPGHRRTPDPGTAGSSGPARTTEGRGPVDDEASWTWGRVAAETGSTVHPQVQWRQVAGDAGETVVLRGGWVLGPPETGRLEPDLLARLMVLAAPATTTPQELMLGVWDGWGELYPHRSAPLVREGATARERRAARAELWAAVVAAVDPEVARALAHGPLLELPDRRYVLLQTTAHELSDPAWPRRAGIGWHHELPGPMPQLIWPADRAWCVASEIDWDSTVVGGSHDLITSVLEDGVLEAVRIEPSDDLSWDGDDLDHPS